MNRPTIAWGWGKESGLEREARSVNKSDQTPAFGPQVTGILQRKGQQASKKIYYMPCDV